ncbi:hypothetical protein L249_0797 [Ophiocordyceps polyrhachis-furcata BCC 54312]|uniref:Deacetylase sirtuin-type domain-containing protein n=1 Tax=Ophiocordyceps polyrhachis-furcata BCC 54312 TaxID=1330021 RepID=A0A367LG30_9HYPO|nr:hypothetical protein L249_0797 [Ophiocordyceps polyrhachis-furcata BCC 54312]
MKVALLALAAASALAAPKAKMASDERVLYFLDSNPSKASIYAVPINRDGSLPGAKSVVKTKTGGVGAISKNKDGTVKTDPLFSQDSVIVKGNQLFTVNPGSNTVSRFLIPNKDPLHPKLEGEPVSSGGEFPNSIAYSEKNKLACVSNTGNKAGVQCFSVPERGPLEHMGGFMPLPVNQTSPPVGPINTVSDIVFNPSETALYVSIKGDGKGLGYLYAYRVVNGKVDPTPVISRPPGLMVDFSLTFFSDDAAVMTDAAYGASYLALGKDLSATVSKKIEIPGQNATCWSVYSPAFNAVYVTDVKSPNITTLDPTSGEIKFVSPGDKKAMGSVDAIADRSWLYVLQAIPAIARFDLRGSDNGRMKPPTVQKIVGEILPAQGGVAFAKEARDLLIECCVEFITLISSEANEISEKEAKKTIACDHITKALEQLGFSDYVPAVLEAAAEHKEVQKGREKKADKFANSPPGRSLPVAAMGQEESMLVGDSVSSESLSARTLAAVASYINSPPRKRVVVLTGAGISTAAGIPDFRSPKTGLYSNLARLDLPHAEAVFDISYFRNRPEPFYALARELYPGKFHPTVSHAFIALLAKKGLLQMLFTQNIDCLERAAGVPEDRIVEAHGSFATQRCIDCKTTFPDDEMRGCVFDGKVPRCDCGGIVKPDIVFFGESLPRDFEQKAFNVAMADIVLILGTSLSVYPFAGLPEMATRGKPRVLLNMERVGRIGSRPDDVLEIGSCDEGTRKLADALGWREELETLWRQVVGEEEAEKQLQRRASVDEDAEDEMQRLTEGIEEALRLEEADDRPCSSRGEEDQSRAAERAEAKLSSPPHDGADDGGDGDEGKRV